MATLNDWQVTVSNVASVITEEEIEAFADVLAHGAAVSHDGLNIEATFHVLAADAGTAASQARMLAATAAMFSITSQSLVRWTATATPYEDLDV